MTECSSLQKKELESGRKNNLYQNKSQVKAWDFLFILLWRKPKIDYLFYTGCGQSTGFSNGMIHHVQAKNSYSSSNCNHH